MDQINNIEDKKALENFLLDIECLAPLNEYTGGVNVFDILKVTKSELIHSNILAWLLNANESHGFGSKFIRGIFQIFIENSDTLHDFIFTLLLADYHDFIIKREVYNMDLLLISEQRKIVVCIENKIKAREAHAQLNKYRAQIEKLYDSGEWIRIFIFLTPSGDLPSDPDNWFTMSYQQIANLLENCIKSSELTDDSKMIVEHYLQTLRRNIVDDNNLIKICNEIYRNHQKALDLIFENRHDQKRIVYDALIDWCLEESDKGRILFNEKFSNKTLIRFKTENLNKIYPPYTEAGRISGWNNEHPAFYEIYNTGDKISMTCQVSSKNMDDSLLERTRRIHKITKDKKSLPDAWVWKRIFSYKQLKIEGADEISIDRENIKNYLNKSFEAIKNFENKMIEALGL